MERTSKHCSVNWAQGLNDTHSQKVKDEYQYSVILFISGVHCPLVLFSYRAVWNGWILARNNLDNGLKSISSISVRINKFQLYVSLFHNRDVGFSEWEKNLTLMNSVLEKSVLVSSPQPWVDQLVNEQSWLLLQLFGWKTEFDVLHFFCSFIFPYSRNVTFYSVYLSKIHKQ